MKTLKLIIILSLLFININAAEFKKPNVEGEENGNNLKTPMIPLIPALSTEDKENETEKRILEKTYTVMLESKIKVFVPLEILTDIDIDALIIGNEEVKVPFDIELNKEPEKLNWYRLHYSETEIDIDNDGNADTFIYSPKYINSRIMKNNYVKIQGDKISNDGEYKRKVFMTVIIDE